MDSKTELLVILLAHAAPVFFSGRHQPTPEESHPHLRTRHETHRNPKPNATSDITIAITAIANPDEISR
jgi:hypothetical protein